MFRPAAKARARCVPFIVICTLATFSSATLAAQALAGDDGSRHGGRWVGSWSASPQTGFFLNDFNNQSFRMIVHSSLGGDRLRVRLSNAFGTQPVTVGAVYVGIRSVGAAIVSGSNHAVTSTEALPSPSRKERWQSAIASNWLCLPSQTLP